jgi:altronate hydrolase
MPSLAQVDVVHLHRDDNIVVAARNLASGEAVEVEGQVVTAAELIRIGHKMAIAPIRKGDRVLKYGQTIGVATQSVEPGQWVHSHNVIHNTGERDFAPCSETPQDPEPILGRTFQGYRRANGKAGTRNYIAVISTVNCSATVSKYVAHRFDQSLFREYPNVDGVIPFTHGSGCGMQYRGSAHEMLNRTLAGIARHPNIGGYLLIGLGCEQGAMGYLLESQGLVQINGRTGQRQGPPVLSMQDVGGTLKTVEEGVRQIARLLPQANEARRESIPASEIILGTNCGGSDGNSGVTANPALGVASDMLVACGGTVILAETPEIYGAEHLLTRRAKSPQAAQKLLDRIEWWKWYTGVFGAEMDNNPSVGNKEGGLTTIAEKSLGAVAKAGSTAMVDVFEYAEPVTAKGFVVMDTPGFDSPSVTGIVAGGANVVVFTTGRGSCYGCKPTPSIKVATNTPMYERMLDDMDINAGVVLQGATVREVGEQIFEEILAVASGKKTKSEQYGIGDEEFVPWLVGPTL